MIATQEVCYCVNVAKNNFFVVSMCGNLSADR